ncbi:MAG: hypothetical protein IJ398_04175 [Clostridia bacterium]|nr:hypothetical protein [Clostridia bacterium]
MKLFKVTAKCGHVGKNYFVIKEFAIKAENGKEAARIVRDIPRVKHHRKDAILNVVEITETEYEMILLKNSLDPYFQCTSIQEQRLYGEMEIYVEYERKQIEREENIKTVYYGKTLVRNPKKFMKNILATERYAYAN